MSTKTLSLFAALALVSVPATASAANSVIFLHPDGAGVAAWNAVRMLEASVPAGIEAPLRFYLTENADQSSTLSWRTPSAVFAPYASPQLDALAHELDAIFEAIVGDATR